MVRRLLYMNGLATLGVVLNHASAWGFIAMFAWTNRYLPVEVPNYDQLGDLGYYSLRVVEQLIIFSIPAFLFVSGFFIAVATGRNQTNISWKLVRTRIRNLVIPYLIWSAAILSMDYLQGQVYTFSGYLKIILTGRAEAPFYFVPLLCQLYILSPFIVPFARSRWRPLLILLLIVQLAVQFIKYPVELGLGIPLFDRLEWLTAGWIFAGHIFWFVAGIVVGFSLLNLKPWLARHKWRLMAAAALFFILGIVEWELILRFSGKDWIGPWETIIDSLYAGAFIFTFLAFDQVSLPAAKQVSELGTKSFGVYLVHSPVLEYASRITYHLMPWLLAYQILFQPMLIALGLGIPLILMLLIGKSQARVFYSYLFG